MSNDEAEREAMDETSVKEEEFNVVKETIKVSRMYREGKIISKEEAEEEPIDVRSFQEGMAQVSYGCRMTINTGNYESVQISVDVQLPCYLEEIVDAYKAARQFVSTRLSSEVESIRDYRKDKN